MFQLGYLKGGKLDILSTGPFMEALALTLVDVPITFVTMILFSFTLYFLVGFQQTAGQAM